MPDTQYQPSSVLFRHKDFTQHISAVLGVKGFHEDYDNFFTGAKLVMEFIPELKIALDEGVCKAPKDFIFPHTYAERLDAIWNGICHYAIIDNPFKKEFCYKYPESNYDEIIPLPPMCDMIPIGELKDDTLWVQIRTTMAVKYAFEGMNWAVLVEEGKFNITTKEGVVATLEKEDMESTTKFTVVIARHVYHAIMKDYRTFFIKNWAHIAVQCQKLIDYSGLMLVAEEEEAPGLMKDMK